MAVDSSQLSERVDSTKKQRRTWLVVLGVIAFLIFGYSLFVMYKVGGLRQRAQSATDFWLRDIGIGGIEAGVSRDVCDNTCSDVCLGPRPNTNPLNTILLLPISRARICCHDLCNKAACGVPRVDDTICGHRIDGWTVIGAPTSFISCIFDNI